MIVNWFKERRKKKDAAKKAAAYAQFIAHFKADYAKPNTEVHQTVLFYAHAMARGMMMRWLDDRGERRCRLCLSTDQLHRRVIASKHVESGRGRKLKQEQVIYLCTEHKDVAMPGMVDQQDDGAKDRQKLREGLQGAAPDGVDQKFLRKHAQGSEAKLEPQAMLDILDTYAKADKEGKSLYETHPPIPIRRDGSTSRVDVVEESPGVYRMVPPPPHVGPKEAGR